MAHHQTTCDPRRIERCLGDQLTDEERAAFESHLEHCSICRQTLESRAASVDVWQAAREFLSPYHDETDALGAASGERPELAYIDGVLVSLAPSDDPRMLGRLGGYEVVGVVGRGGMGVVLKALDTALNRYVAIKVLAPHLAVSGAARQRFAREARSAASVVHENVVAIHAVSDAGPLPYFVMPYLRGASLQKRLDAEGPLGVPEILRVARQIAAGLSAAHAQGLVHRDIKPANIMLEDGIERLKITDFGLARAADDASLTRTGIIAGTPQFMSPEQARGDAVDPRSDLFSLASVMYAMCVGHPPFRAETSYGILQRIIHDTPRPIREMNPDIPDWLAAVVEKLHAKIPDDRFDSAEEVAWLLEQCTAHVQQPTATALPKEVAKLTAAQRRVLCPLPLGEAEGSPRRNRGEGAQNFLRRNRYSITGATFTALALTIAFLLLNASRQKETNLPSPLARGEGPGVRGKTAATDGPESAWHDDIAWQLIETEHAVSQLEAGVLASRSELGTTIDQEILNLKSQFSNLEAEVSESPSEIPNLKSEIPARESEIPNPNSSPASPPKESTP